MRTSLLFLVGASLLLSAAVAAQPEVTVGEISAPAVSWGDQTVFATVTNTVEYPKVLSSLVKITFEGTYLNPSRMYRTNYVIEPSVTAKLAIHFEMPMNYGTAHMDITLFDVIDSLDLLLSDQQIAQQHYELTFRVPDNLAKYTQERITMPPMTEHSPLLDAEFDRIAFLLFKEGKTSDEVAASAKVDTAYFSRVVKKWKQYHLIEGGTPDSALRPAFPILSMAQADAIRPLVDKTASQLEKLITKNIGQPYSKVLDSLVLAGKVAKDSNDFLNGGVLLYRTYPVVTALLLWYDWGRQFITGTGQDALLFYLGTDPCNATMPTYMYAIQGGDVVNGHHYFDMSYTDGRPMITFADQIPEVRCPELYPFADQLPFGPVRGWYYAGNIGPEYFTFDAEAAKPALHTLEAGSREILDQASTDLRAALEKVEPGSFTQGTRYWFWNLTATRTIDKLVADSVILRRGNGYYRVESL